MDSKLSGLCIFLVRMPPEVAAEDNVDNVRTSDDELPDDVEDGLGRGGGSFIGEVDSSCPWGENVKTSKNVFRSVEGSLA